jgi:hypothetical protein
MARPNKKESLAIRKRNRQILKMRMTGYPIDYIAEYFNKSKSTISEIITNEEIKQGYR